MTNNQPSAWNPGLQPTLPRQYAHLQTLFRPEHSFTSYEKAHELAEATGFAPEELSIFRPERLALHEVMIAVMTELTIDQGNKYSDMGVNYRHIVQAIMDGHITPHVDALSATYDNFHRKAKDTIEDALNEWLAPPQAASAPAQKGFLSRLFKGKTAPVVAQAAYGLERDLAIIEQCRQREEGFEGAPHPGMVTYASYMTLSRVLRRIVGKGRQIGHNRELILKLATDMTCNATVGALIAEQIRPWLDEAIESNGYRRLTLQDKPVIMSVKGPSASGKSTQRAPLRHLAEELGLNWDDFAMISPDVIRKYLLDYSSLGEATLYAGVLTGQELSIIDHKLDERLSILAAFTGRKRHLLIDRFRDDTFSNINTSGPYVSRAETMYMFFMVTPPDQIVERGWLRGLDIGRYKAVEDFLAHCVEGYDGMQTLLFKWMHAEKPDYHFEIVDNSVPKGQRPLAAAFGHKDEMSILSPALLIDIDRYTKINMNAKSADQVYPADKMVPAQNLNFVDAIIDKMRVVDFIDRSSGVIYARYCEGNLRIKDERLYDEHCKNADEAAVFGRIAERGPTVMANHKGQREQLDRKTTHTMGRHNSKGNTARPRI